MFSICFKIETCSVYVIHTNKLAVFFFTVFVGTLLCFLVLYCHLLITGLE